MTQQHPITPPLELVKQWIKEFSQPNDPRWQEYEQDIATRASQWGADQELEACCKMLYDRYDRVRHATGFPGSDMSDWLRAARRPKPPSLKEQALLAIDTAVADYRIAADVADVVRRALEQLPDNN
jgi:hypothetical protein